MENVIKSGEIVSSIIAEMMDRVMTRVISSDPFIPEEHHAMKPLYAALVPDEIFKGSHFERRFVTPFGSVWEKLAIAVAQEKFKTCHKGYTVEGQIRRDRLRRIQTVLDRLEHPEKGKKSLDPNWSNELDYILKGQGELIPCTVVCDIYVEDSLNHKYAFELKAPLPNSDQTKVSKEKMLKLFAMENDIITSAYFALPYNPYGKREDYNWKFPARWFNMKEDSVVLIGNDFWDFIGGIGTYQSFISEVNKLGTVYKERIYKEYLGIDPIQKENQYKL